MNESATKGQQGTPTASEAAVKEDRDQAKELRQTETPGWVRKRRLDVLLVERGLVATRQKAQALVLAGKVFVNGAKIVKAGTAVESDAAITLQESQRYVGRGGYKLEGALRYLGLDISGMVFLDVGSSTGGFVDCLLQHGARRVIAVDVGTGQLDWRLREDKRVRLLERTNARYLAWEQIGEKVDGITMDVSFISATLILPALVQFARGGTLLLVLVKPQFEAGKESVGRGGIVTDPAVQASALRKVRECAARLGFTGLTDFPSLLPGAEGNREFFLAGTFAAASSH